MSVSFTQKDLSFFHIPDFTGRMSAIKAQIRPKLEALGEELGPPLMKKFNQEFFAHTAKHMRRKVNPPDETWVAIGPQKRGYKAYIFFAFCLGKNGAQVRVTMKDECPLRPALGRNLAANQKFFLGQVKKLKGLGNYTKRNEDYEPQAIVKLDQFLENSSERLANLKSAVFDVGLEIDPKQNKLSQSIINTIERLWPFYECGLKDRVRLQ